ncbi:hypothetical protein PAN31117_01487 [Pandoraea anapnoica]|uniref:Uncharacterized protein n=2 Tax=Pandoraea anapnoica TaxID=2508301 RepID=A0A5E4ZS97_9BURK|nr:hypothetical protein PAN31117_01487 [Pandoraea anapnoica]
MFSAISTLPALYWIFASEQGRAAGLFPGSTLSVSWQWALVALGACWSAVCAIALMQRYAWAKTLLILQVISSSALTWFIGKSGPMTHLSTLLVAVLPLLIVLRVPIERVREWRSRTMTQQIRRIFGLCAYGFSIALMFLILMALFSGTSATANTMATTSTTAISVVVVALLIMLFGGVVWGDRSAARRAAGLSLIALAIFMVVQCVMAAAYVREYAPQAPSLLHWSETLPMLLFLAMTGFTVRRMVRER